MTPEESPRRKQNDSEIDRDVECECSTVEVIFKKRELVLNRDSGSIEKIGDRKTAFEYRLIAEITGSWTTEVAVHNLLRPRSLDVYR
jgi:hypothetical protein